QVVRPAADADDAGERFVYQPSAFAVAPAWHDQRTGEDAGALLPGPPRRLKELVRAVGLPVGEQQLGFRRQGVDHLAAEDAVLAVLRLEVAVGSEGTAGYPVRQGMSQVRPVAAEAGVKDRHLDAPAAVPLGVPALDAEPGQVLLALPGRIAGAGRDGGLRGRL